VAVVGADGATAVVTGGLCLDHAGHAAGDGYTAQANMVSSPDVWGEMAAAYERADGSLARRLLAALDAGDAAGGDARGRMSAALLVVGGQIPAGPAGPAEGAVVDLRVDRSDDPLGDLGRLLDAAEAFAGFDTAADQLFGGDPAAALGTIDTALDALPGEENLRSIRAGALLASGAVDEGVAEVRALVDARPTWEIILRSFADRGMFAVPDGLSIDDLFR
jgi:uncharacterized Ntn-hydrolase superfamily protein